MKFVIYVVRGPVLNVVHCSQVRGDQLGEGGGAIRAGAVAGLLLRVLHVDPRAFLTKKSKILLAKNVFFVFLSHLLVQS